VERKGAEEMVRKENGGKGEREGEIWGEYHLDLLHFPHPPRKKIPSYSTGRRDA